MSYKVLDGWSSTDFHKLWTFYACISSDMLKLDTLTHVMVTTTLWLWSTLVDKWIHICKNALLSIVSIRLRWVIMGLLKFEWHSTSARNYRTRKQKAEISFRKFEGHTRAFLSCGSRYNCNLINTVKTILYDSAPLVIDFRSSGLIQFLACNLIIPLHRRIVLF